MGTKITDIMPKREVEMTALSGRTIAVDAFNWIYQFISIIRGVDGTPLKDSKGRVTSHLSGLFYRNLKLLEVGIKPIYVFDGKPPELKRGTSEARRERKVEANRKWEEAKEKGDLVSARMYAQATSKLTTEMIEHAKELLGYMGIPVVQALSEGEAQCAHMCKSGLVYATASQDADSLVFGTPRLLRNLSISGRKKVPRKLVYVEVKPNLIDLDSSLKTLGLDRTQLAILAMLVGTDYNPGIRGIGSKKAFKLITEEKTLKNVLKKVDWDSQFDGDVVDPQRILDFFMNPPVEDVKVEFGKLDKKKLVGMMSGEFEFSADRIAGAIDKMEKKPKIHGLGKWVK